MKEAVKALDKNQIEFICKECSTTKELLMAMDEDTLYDEVYEKMCDIEVEESLITDDEESARCVLASGIVTFLGNTLAKEMGY